MMPTPAAFARSTNVASTFRKQNSEMAGTLVRNMRLWVPDGEMSSVETLSPSTIRTGAVRLSGKACPRGTSLMFGPLITRALAASAAGAGGTRPAIDAASDAG